MDFTYFGTETYGVYREELKRILDTIPKINGTCIFIDMRGSTKAKQEKSSIEWFLLILNTIITQCRSFLSWLEPLKVIGDEIMYFIPDETLLSNEENYDSLLGILKSLIPNWDNELNQAVSKIKIAIHYCKNVYPITFSKDKQGNPLPDYYGLDIDLTARLMKVDEIDQSENKEDNILIVSDQYANKLHPGTSDFIACSSDKLKGLSTSKYWIYTSQTKNSPTG